MAAATGLAAVAPVPPPAPACGAINAAVPLPELLARLGKKAHFEDAVRQLTQQAMLGTHSAEQLLPLAARTHALLKARYTAPGFWQAGQRLWRALLEHPGDALAPGDKAKLAAYLADAQQFSEPGEEAGPREPTLGELLFGLPPPGQASSHLSDVGLVLDEDRPAPSMRPASFLPPGLEAALQHSEGEAEGGVDSSNGAAEDMEARVAAALETEAGRAEMQALMEAFAAEAGAAGATDPSRPPASKRVVASLPKIKVDAEQLQQLGGPGTACPVCTEQLVEGDEVQLLPCKHVFHPPCLAPWLADNNSCPMCRDELPTDDAKYEARKERAAQEVEERRGAENALSHNEFMYI